MSQVGKCEGMEREVLEGKRAQSELEKTRQELERVKDALEKEKEEARAWRNEKAIDDAMSSGRNSRASSADSTGSASSNVKSLSLCSKIFVLINTCNASLSRRSSAGLFPAPRPRDASTRRSPSRTTSSP